MKKILKTITGYKHNYGGRDRSYRFTWGEVALLSKGFGIKWQSSHYCYEPKLVIELYFFALYINTSNFGLDPGKFTSSDGIKYGFYVYPKLFSMEDLVLLWGSKSKTIHMPWTYEWESTELLDDSFGVVAKDTATSAKKLGWEVFNKASTAHRENGKEYDYTYTLKNGTVQHRKAKVSIERRTWKMRGWPWKKLIRTSIDVAFNEEVGEGTGSWKGGTVGCGYNLLPNETPEQCLRRMEKERVFK